MVFPTMFNNNNYKFSIVIPKCLFSRDVNYYCSRRYQAPFLSQPVC